MRMVPPASAPRAVALTQMVGRNRVSIDEAALSDITGISCILRGSHRREFYLPQAPISRVSGGPIAQKMLYGRKLTAHMEVDGLCVLLACHLAFSRYGQFCHVGQCRHQTAP